MDSKVLIMAGLKSSQNSNLSSQLKCTFCYRRYNYIDADLRNHRKILTVCSMYLKEDILPQNLILINNCNLDLSQRQFPLCLDCLNLANTLAVMTDQLEEIQKRINVYVEFLSSSIIKQRHNKHPEKQSQEKNIVQINTVPVPLVTIQDNDEMEDEIDMLEAPSHAIKEPAKNPKIQCNMVETTGRKSNLKAKSHSKTTVAKDKAHIQVGFSKQSDVMISEEKKSSYRCKICLKEISSVSNLKLHLRVHTGETPYKCRLCHMLFKTKSNLNRHLKRKVHENSLHFGCSICNTKFESPIALKKHNIYHHKTSFVDSHSSIDSVQSIDEFQDISQSGSELMVGEDSEDCTDGSSTLDPLQLPDGFDDQVEVKYEREDV